VRAFVAEPSAGAFSVTTGAELSTTTVRAALSAACPAPSVARASTRYVPSPGWSVQTTPKSGPVELVPIGVCGVHDAPAHDR
jgi:hypothetical protein